MRKSEAYLLNQGIVFASFVCSLNGNEVLGMCIGCIALLYACMTISIHVLKHDWLWIGVVAFIELCVFELTLLNKSIPSIYFLSIMSLLVTCIWYHTSDKAKSYGIRWMKIVGVVFLLACFVCPMGNRMPLFVITCALFLPTYILDYVSQKEMHRNHALTIVKWFS